MKTSVPINKEWHDQNPMPKNPSREQRITWHLAHSQVCNCLEIPEALKEEISRRLKKSA